MYVILHVDAIGDVSWHCIATHTCMLRIQWPVWYTKIEMMHIHITSHQHPHTLLFAHNTKCAFCATLAIQNKDKQKPVGNFEVSSHESIDTRMRLFASSAACRVKIRILGNCLLTGTKSTCLSRPFCCVSMLLFYFPLLLGLVYDMEK